LIRPSKNQKSGGVKMKYKYNDGSLAENAVQNRFTAYLAAAVEHRRKRYINKLSQTRYREVCYQDDCDIWNNCDPAGVDPDTLYENEISDERLRLAIARLHEREQCILIQHAVNGNSLIRIAEEMAIPYPTVKSIYRRTLEKIRKELLNDEF
jgi:RNA polymerase sigma factor (sigma-70 family)